MRQQTFVNGKPILYLVATPIGNLDEFTTRAIETLKKVVLIGCEDTRTSKVLLDRFDIKTPTISYHKFNEKEASSRFLEELEKGNDVAIISDAGYPSISDPGNIVVEEAINRGFNVSVVSGACAFLNALVGSGFPTSNFLFYGFLDSKKSARKKQLEELKEISQLLIFYEAPHRIKETLEDMLAVFGDRKMVLARELTKKFEEYVRGSISEVVEIADTLKGEMVLLIEGVNIQKEELSDEEIEKEANKLFKKGKTKKEIISEICTKHNLKKNRVYDLVCKIEGDK